jgi:transglutaminase-like putative cysteine protease
MHQIIKRFVLLWLMTIGIAQARFATKEDAPVDYIQYNRDIVVEKDGRSEENIRYEIKINNEQGRAAYATQTFRYNGNIQKLDVISAQTLVNGQVFKVPKETIEVKPLASAEKGFDQAYQVMVSYPNVVVGAIIKMEYRLTTKQQPLPNYFSTNAYFGKSGYWISSRVTLKSALPFYWHVNDPKQALKIEESKKEGIQSLSITLTKPVYTELVNEVTLDDDSKNVYVDISTLKSFTEIGASLSEAYQAVIEEPLPPLLENMRKQAEPLQNEPVAQINKVTSLLEEHIRYMGDWRSIDGQFKPRPLTTIASTGVSDCKDYSVSLAAILRRLGYEAYAALVYRGEAYYPPTHDLPAMGQFNHAIVYAVDPFGIARWLDPTNFVSMAQGIFPDISDRPALILNPTAPRYASIPAVQALHNAVESNKTLKLSKEGALISKGSMLLKGEAAIPVTGATLRRSEAAIKEALIDILSGEKNPLEKTITLPPLNSRIVKDVTIQYGFVQEDATMTTNVGQALSLGGEWAALVLNTSKDQEGITYLGTPKSEEEVLFLPGAKAKAVQTLNVRIQSPWITFSRSAESTDQGVKITQKTEILQRFIKAEIVRSEAFQAMKKKVKQAVVGVALVFE